MAQSKVAISVESVYKDFALPHEKKNSLKSVFVHPFQKKKVVIHTMPYEIYPSK